MIFIPKYKDEKKMTNSEIVQEKNELLEEINTMERKVFAFSKEPSSLWVEDKAILYEMNIERLSILLKEIKRRLSSNKWFWDEDGYRKLIAER